MEIDKKILEKTFDFHGHICRASAIGDLSEKYVRWIVTAADGCVAAQAAARYGEGKKG